MSDTAWLTDNWPWWAVIFFLVVYEFYALFTGKGRTLSRMVWTSAKAYPWMVPIALSVLSWLLVHFFLTKGELVLELLITAALVAVIWMFYAAWQRKAT